MDVKTSILFHLLTSGYKYMDAHQTLPSIPRIYPIVNSIHKYALPYHVIQGYKQSHQMLPLGSKPTLQMKTCTLNKHVFNHLLVTLINVSLGSYLQVGSPNN